MEAPVWRAAGYDAADAADTIFAAAELQLQDARTQMHQIQIQIQSQIQTHRYTKLPPNLRVSSLPRRTPGGCWTAPLTLNSFVGLCRFCAHFPLPLLQHSRCSYRCRCRCQKWKEAAGGRWSVVNGQKTGSNVGDRRRRSYASVFVCVCASVSVCAAQLSQKYAKIFSLVSALQHRCFFFSAAVSWHFFVQFNFHSPCSRNYFKIYLWKIISLAFNTVFVFIVVSNRTHTHASRHTHRRMQPCVSVCLAV